MGTKHRATRRSAPDAETLAKVAGDAAVTPPRRRAGRKPASVADNVTATDPRTSEARSDAPVVTDEPLQAPAVGRPAVIPIRATDALSVMVDERALQDGDALMLQARPDIFEDAELRSMQSRAAAYLRAGVPVHFRGPAGSGKTTLALHIAARLKRPVTLISGDAGLTSSDLLGRTLGETVTRVRDRYIHSVERSSSTTRVAWEDGALTRAVEQGHTLVYDEFTRAPAEANNALLSALEERLIVFANPSRPSRYVRAHPEFRALLTSNPDEYAGVTAAPDALFDRMVTFDLTWWTMETECGIVARRTGLAPAAAATVVRLVRVLRRHVGGSNPPSIRTAIMIGRIIGAQGVPASPVDERFVQVCLDVLETRAPRTAGAAARDAYLADLRAAILASRHDVPTPEHAA